MLATNETFDFESDGVTWGATTLVDGTVVAISSGASELDPSCEALFDAAEVEPAMLELWHLDGTRTTVELPDGFEVGGLFAAGLPPTIHRNQKAGVYVWNWGKIWRFDTTSSLWTELPGLGLSDLAMPVALPRFRGARVAAMDGGALRVLDFDTGEVLDIRVDESASRYGENHVLYLDENYAFVALDGQLVRVTLPSDR